LVHFSIVDLPLQFQTNYDPRMARAFAALQGVKSRVYNSVALTTMLGISEEELRAFEPPPLEPSFNLLGAAVLIALIPPTAPDQGEPRLIVLDGGENLMRCAQQGEDIYGLRPASEAPPVLLQDALARKDTRCAAL
jgi:hypothetical protein